MRFIFDIERDIALIEIIVIICYEIPCYTNNNQC